MGRLVIAAAVALLDGVGTSAAAGAGGALGALGAGTTGAAGPSGAMGVVFKSGAAGSVRHRAHSHRRT